MKYFISSYVEHFTLGTLWWKGKPCLMFLKTPPTFSLSLSPPIAVGRNVTVGAHPQPRELWGQARWTGDLWYKLLLVPLPWRWLWWKGTDSHAAPGLCAPVIAGSIKPLWKVIPSGWIRGTDTHGSTLIVWGGCNTKSGVTALFSTMS